MFNGVIKWAFHGQLKVQEGELFGKPPCGSRDILRPYDIQKVREYGLNNPMLVVETADWKYRVRPWSRHYSDVCDWLRENLKGEPGMRDKAVRWYNKILFGRWFDIWNDEGG